MEPGATRGPLVARRVGEAHALQTRRGILTCLWEADPTSRNQLPNRNNSSLYHTLHWGHREPHRRPRDVETGPLVSGPSVCPGSSRWLHLAGAQIPSRAVAASFRSGFHMPPCGAAQASRQTSSPRPGASQSPLCRC